MAKTKVLITGGAGFIGSHLADHMLSNGYEVSVLDSLEPQVHPGRRKPDYLNPEVKLWAGRVGDRGLLDRALDGVEVVVHLASVVGVGQSMYEIERYTLSNVADTATLLEVLTQRQPRVRRLVVASSMSLYGEGLYRCPGCGADRAPAVRPVEQLKARDWEMRCPDCRGAMEPLPTPEDKLPQPTSVYAINKRDQEEMCLSIGRAYKIPTVALRFFNVFGTRQALSNPYTGVVAIFSGRLLNDRPPIIFEDGRQSRDFIHVSDLARALRLAVERADVSYEAINLGSGKPVTVLEVARSLSELLGRRGEPRIVNEFREGDIRHCFADGAKAKRLLGFSPDKSFSDGMRELLDWMRTQKPEDSGDAAYAELKKRQLAG
ncbi:MAG: NAD-dependent epimerase/dehydratase family protein [Elusimicrobiota bacterium]